MNYYPVATLALIAVTIIAGVLTGIDGNLAPKLDFYINNPYDGGTGFLADVQNGEFWRLITPIFLHFTELHLFMNLVWLYMLGSRIEAAYSPLHILAMTLIFGMAGNLLQYVIDGPSFGGMSGVVYGMLIYTWAHGRWMPRARVAISDQIILFILASGVISIVLGLPVAHWAHAGGALAGLAWAKLESDRAKRNRYRR